jgi:hypothetical protein
MFLSFEVLCGCGAADWSGLSASGIGTALLVREVVFWHDADGGASRAAVTSEKWSHVWSNGFG